MSKISRRDFLKGTAAGIGVAALGSIGVSASAADDASKAVGGSEPAWDEEYDVVVLGFGGAGANAAVAAYENGARVLLAEKAPEGLEGGNTQAAGQAVMATDDPDQLYDYIKNMNGRFQNWDGDAVRAFCEGCAGNFDWMTKVLGADPEVLCPTEPGMDIPVIHGFWRKEDNPWNIGREGYVFSWQENPEYESSKHCLILKLSEFGFDRKYYDLCHQAVLDRPDIDLWFDAPGKKLITDENGAVIGVVIEKDGKDVRVKANGGVVLATGGFEHNKEMVSSYLQQPYVHQHSGLYNDGDGIKMAMAVGADLWHMSNSAGFTWAYKSPHLTTVAHDAPTATQGVIVGVNGARFMNEAAPTRHGRIDIGGRLISTPMPLPSYVVHDADQIENKFAPFFSDGYVEEIANGEVLTGDTLEELAEAIRNSNGGKDAPEFNTEKFVAAINAYNKRYDAGEDADYGRPYDTMVPVKTGPFYAVKIGPTYYNTMGGPRRNKYAQVINLDGYPIEGLFSAGELGSIFCDLYNGGGNLGETVVFGRMAGQNAAMRAQGKFTGTTEPVTTWMGEDDEDEASSSIVAGPYTDGVYEGNGHGFNANIKVSVTVTDGKISNIEVLEHAETPGIGEAALPDYCKQTVETQNLDLDVVSSASNTLRGYKEAVNDALSKAVK